MSNKQSSVEWLYDKIILKLYKLQKIEYTHIFLEELEQAKAMHKEEVLSFNTLLYKHEMEALNNNTILLTKEEFYELTFGGNNEQQ